MMNFQKHKRELIFRTNVLNWKFITITSNISLNSMKLFMSSIQSKASIFCNLKICQDSQLTNNNRILFFDKQNYYAIDS